MEKERIDSFSDDEIFEKTKERARQLIEALEKGELPADLIDAEEVESARPLKNALAGKKAQPENVSVKKPLTSSQAIHDWEEKRERGRNEAA